MLFSHNSFDDNNRIGIHDKEPTTEHNNKNNLLDHIWKKPNCNCLFWYVVCTRWVMSVMISFNQYLEPLNLNCKTRQFSLGRIAILLSKNLTGKSGVPCVFSLVDWICIQVVNTVSYSYSICFTSSNTLYKFLLTIYNPNQFSSLKFCFDTWCLSFCTLSCLFLLSLKHSTSLFLFLMCE